MNMKKIFSIAVAVLALAGCQKSLEYRDVLYFTGTEDNPAVSMYVDGPASKNLTVSSSKVYDEDVNIAVTVDPSALEAFNAANGTSYQMLPEGSYQLSDNHFTIYAGTSVSAPVAFSIVSMDDFEEGVLYCAPVRLLAAADGSNILYPSQTIFLVINSIITTRCVNLAGSNWYNMETMVNNSDLANLPAVTLEARVYMNGWSNLSHKIASVVGIEEHMIVRFGDVSCDRDQLQVAGRGVSLTSTDHFSLGRWYHIVAIDDGSKLRLYVDGKLEGEVDSSGKAALNLGANAEGGGFRIGASAGDNRPLNGYISEVRAWKRALSIVEAENNQCYVNPETAQDLVGYWRMDQLDESGKLVDLSGNGYVGTPRGGTNWVDGIKCPVVE